LEKKKNEIVGAPVAHPLLQKMDKEILDYMEDKEKKEK
jgi:hypothetical protein